MKFKDKKVLVFGSGISGVSAAALLLQEGAEVVLYDGMTGWMRQESKNRSKDRQRGA